MYHIVLLSTVHPTGIPRYLYTVHYIPMYLHALSFVLISLKMSTNKRTSRLIIGNGTTPPLDDGLHGLPGVDPGGGAHLLGHVHTGLLGHQAGHDGDLLAASLLWDHVAFLLGYLLDKLKWGSNEWVHSSTSNSDWRYTVCVKLTCLISSLHFLSPFLMGHVSGPQTFLGFELQSCLGTTYVIEIITCVNSRHICEKNSV